MTDTVSLAVITGRPTVIARANPVAKIAAASVLALALIVTLDPVTAAVALAGEVLALPWAGVPASALARRLVIVGVGAVPSAVLTAVLGPDAGPVLVRAGPLTLTAGSASAGVAVGLRIAAIGLPGVVLLATTDPTDLADALAQVLHLPSRFVLAALAALRLFEVLVEEWRTLGQARRARGLGDDGFVRRVTGLVARAFALLVLALRRAAVLATAMEARGFGTDAPRTWARPSRIRRADVGLVVAAALLAAVATLAGAIAPSIMGEMAL